mmetsp:Transcript_80626/g.181938  ORF Transcript_80626/g.181938 Transcript_80626/m.181938 type:complete len:137 (-) Transcript_80626:257-667(-)
MAEQAATERRLITDEEIAKHNSEKDCWLRMHNLVVALPKDFLDEHPGGPDVITCLAGKDATSDFEDISHSDSARVWASKYIIGYTNADDEEAKTRMIPKMSEISGRPNGGGGSAILPAIVVVILAALAYVFLKVKA